MPKIIELSGVVGAEITAKNLKNRLPKDGSDVLLKIDSVGGSVFEGNRLFNALNDHLNKFPGTITAELGAVAASAASYFPLAIGAENIRVRNNTTFMGHKAWTFAIGNADDMKAEAEILDGFDNIIAKVYSGITGKSVDDSLEDMKNEFWLIGGESVVDAGFASGLVDEEQTEPEEQNVIEKSEVLAMMKEAKNKIREIENQEDLNKWAAKIEKTLNAVNVEPDGQKLLFSESAPSGAKNKSEVDMNLSEYLDQNPEAKAEYTEKLNTAGADRVEAAVSETIKNYSEVIALSGVKVPENVLEFANSGGSVADFAVAELKARNEKLDKVTEEEQNLGKLDASNQTPEKVDEDSDKAVDVMDKALDALIGTKEGK